MQREGGDVGKSGQSCSLLSSGSLLGLSPDPRFPEEAPHLLFLQEGHLQALQVQEPAQLQEPAARKGKASRKEVPPQTSAGPSPSSWVRSSPPLSQMEETQLLSSGPRKVDPLPREGPRLQTQPRLTGGQPKPDRSQVYVLNPGRHHVPSCHQSLAAPRSPPSTGSQSSCPLTPWVRTRGTVWSLSTLHSKIESGNSL